MCDCNVLNDLLRASLEMLLYQHAHFIPIRSVTTNNMMRELKKACLQEEALQEGVILLLQYPKLKGASLSVALLSN